jgi:hypothetical protein
MDSPTLRREAADAQEILDLTATVAALDAEIARLKGALGPFAAFDPPRGCGTRDTCVVYGSNVTGTMSEITVGDFRRARSALRPSPSHPPETHEKENR